MDSPTAPVPVIMGPTRHWCEVNLPTQSYIHVEDFETPAQLAKHLVYLSNNQTAYMKHHRWRWHLLFVEETVTLEDKLCLKLSSLNQSVMIVSDFQAFWNQRTCRPSLYKRNFCQYIASLFGFGYGI